MPYYLGCDKEVSQLSRQDHAAITIMVRNLLNFLEKRNV